MFKKFTVGFLIFLFVVLSVFASISYGVYGTLSSRDFYTEKFAYEMYDVFIEGFAESLGEEGFYDDTEEDVEIVLKRIIEPNDFSEIVGDIYDDVRSATVEDGELSVLVSFEKFREKLGELIEEEMGEKVVFEDFPDELIFGLDVGEEIEGNVFEYLGGIVRMIFSVIFAFLLFMMALIALLVLSPWHKIVRTELKVLFSASLAVFISSLVLVSVYRLDSEFLGIEDGGEFVFLFISLFFRDVGMKLMVFALPVMVLTFSGMMIMRKFFQNKKIEDEGKIGK